MRPALLLVLLASAPVLAQTPALPDGPIARGQVLAAARRQFKAMDANGDGTISRAEFESYRAHAQDAPAGDPFGHVGAHWFEHADANKDGRVTPAEAATRPLQLFDTADTNHDGVIDAQERQVAMMMLALRGK